VNPTLIPVGQTAVLRASSREALVAAATAYDDGVWQVLAAPVELSPGLWQVAMFRDSRKPWATFKEEEE